MGKSFADMIKKDKPVETKPAAPTTDKKANAFAALKNKTTAKSATKPAFNLGKAKQNATPPAPQSGVAQTEVAKGPAASRAPSPAASVAAPDVEDRVATIREAKEFIHEDQPDDMTENAVKQLQDSLQTLRDSIDHPELVSEAIKNIMLNLQEHEFLRDNMEPEDYGSMVRGLRVSYGKTIAKKQERSTKRKSNDADVDQIISALGDMNFSLG